MGLGLDQVGHIHGHLLHSGVVEGLNVSQGSLVILGHHVDGHTLSAETATSANPEGRRRQRNDPSVKKIQSLIYFNYEFPKV